MSKAAQFLKREVKDMLPVLLFFFVTFQLLAITNALIALQYGISANAFLNATILAAVVAKVVLIADHMPFVNRFPSRPLIYNIVWKTLIYFAAALTVRYAEHLIHFWRKYSGFVEANRRLFSEIVWPHFWGVQLWLFILLLFFCTTRELIRAMGRDRVVRMFFFEPRPVDQGR